MRLLHGFDAGAWKSGQGSVSRQTCLLPARAREESGWPPIHQQPLDQAFSVFAFATWSVAVSYLRVYRDFPVWRDQTVCAPSLSSAFYLFLKQ